MGGCLSFLLKTKRLPVANPLGYDEIQLIVEVLMRKSKESLSWCEDIAAFVAVFVLPGIWCHLARSFYWRNARTKQAFLERCYKIRQAQLMSRYCWSTLWNSQLATTATDCARAWKATSSWVFPGLVVSNSLLGLAHVRRCENRGNNVTLHTSSFTLRGVALSHTNNRGTRYAVRAQKKLFLLAPQSLS